MFRDLPTRSLLSAAVTCTVLAGVAHGALVIDVQATGVSGAGLTLVNSKSVQVGQTGGIISFGVYATVTPTNATNGFQQTRGSLDASGGTIGSLGAGTLISPFNGSGANAGTVTDTDADGYTEIGATGSGQSIIINRANAMAVGSSFLVYTFNMTVGALGSVGSVQWTGLGSNLQTVWQEASTPTNLVTGTRTIGTPVLLSSNSTVTLLSNASAAGDNPAYENINTTGSNYLYTSAILDTAVNASSGRVDILGTLPTPAADVPITDESPILVAADLIDLTPSDGINDVANFLANANTTSILGGTNSAVLHAVETSGVNFNKINAAYGGGFDVIFNFETPATASAGNLDFAWNFLQFPNVGIDRLVAVPEPSMGLAGLLGATLLAGRRRR